MANEDQTIRPEPRRELNGINKVLSWERNTLARAMDALERNRPCLAYRILMEKMVTINTGYVREYEKLFEEAETGKV